MHLSRSLCIALAIAGACTPTLPEGVFACDSVSDCPAGWICREGFCHAWRAEGDSEAPAGSDADPPAGDSSASGDDDAAAGDSAPRTDQTPPDLCAGVACEPSANACLDAGVCDPSTGGCTYAPRDDGTPCDDGDPCTRSSACAAASCVGSDPITCDSPPAPCLGFGACEPNTGDCGYLPLPAGASCDDGSPCTTSDLCDGAGGCGGTATRCDQPPDACHGLPGSCDESSGACSYPQTATVCDPILYWRLNEGSGTVANDATPSRLHGVLANGATWAGGAFAGGAQLDGWDDGIVIGVADAAPLDRYPLTLALWLYIESWSTAGGRIVSPPLSFGNDYVVSYTAAGRLNGPNCFLVAAATTGAAQCSPDETVKRGTWQHVAVVFDATGNFRTYVDGVNQPLANVSGFERTDGDFVVGNRAFDFARPAHGVFDEVRIYARALNDDEVRQLVSLVP